MEFKNRIKIVRGNLTQKEFAKKLDIHEGTVQLYETGNIPKGDILLHIHEEFGTDITWLLTGKEKLFLDQEASDKPSINEVDNVTYRKPDTSFGTAVDALKEIFDSHDPAVIDAIRSNLYVFRSYVRKDFEIKHQSAEIQTLREDYEELKKRLAILEDEEDDAGSL